MKIIEMAFLKDGVVVGRVTASFETEGSQGYVVWNMDPAPFLLPQYRFMTRNGIFTAWTFAESLQRIARESGLTTTIGESGEWTTNQP